MEAKRNGLTKKDLKWKPILAEGKYLLKAKFTPVMEGIDEEVEILDD